MCVARCFALLNLGSEWYIQIDLHKKMTDLVLIPLRASVNFLPLMCQNGAIGSPQPRNSSREALGLVAFSILKSLSPSFLLSDEFVLFLVNLMPTAQKRFQMRPERNRNPPTRLLSFYQILHRDECGIRAERE